MKVHETIQELAEAIYAIRAGERQPFDPVYAIGQVAAHGMRLGADCLTIQASRHDPSMRAWANDTRLDRLCNHRLSESESTRLTRALAKATRAHAPFTDLLALTSVVLEERRGTSLPNYFLSTQERLKTIELTVGYHAATKNTPPHIGFSDNRAGSIALAAMAALHRDADRLSRTKLSLVLGCSDEHALRVTAMQVLLAVTHFPHYVGFVEVALVPHRRFNLVFAVGRNYPLQKAA